MLELDMLADQFLAMSEADWAAWCASHADQLTLAFMVLLKKRSDDLVRSDPRQAERITRAALQLAPFLPHEPLAVSLAQWARGNWAAYVQPAEAAACYHTALQGYTQVDDLEAQGRLTSNLVYVYTTLGQLEAAIAMAERAQCLFQQLGSVGEPYLVNLGVNYGWLLYECGRYAEALAANEATQILALPHKKYREWAEIQVNQAFTLGMVGRIPESEELLLDSREQLVALEEWLTVARIDLNLADLARALGKPAQALRYFRQARTTFARLGVAMEEASVLLFEAELLVRLGALREALRACGQARERFASENMAHYVALAMVSEAQIRRQLNPADAHLRPLLHEAAARFRLLKLPLEETRVRLEHAAVALASTDLPEAHLLLEVPLPDDAPPNLQAWHSLLCGMLAHHRGDSATALQHFATTRAISYDAHLIWLQREVAAQCGIALAPVAPDQARDYLEDAAQRDELLRADLSVAELAASFQSQRDDVLPLLIRLAIDAQQDLQALHYAWRWNGGALLDLFSVHSRGQHGDADDATELAGLRQHLTMLRWQVVRDQQQGEDEATLEPLRARLREHEQHYLEQRRYLRQKEKAGPHYALPSDPRLLLARLPASGLLEYVRCGDDLFACYVDRHGNCQTTRLGSSDAITDLLGRLEVKLLTYLPLSSAQRLQNQRYSLRETQSILQQLYDRLIAPLALLPKTGPLLIAPCAPLHLVPFAALWDGTTYLVEHYDIELIPSGALLAAPAPLVDPLGPPLIIGASAVKSLTAVAAEVQAITTALPNSISYLDDPEALTALLELRQAPRILHLSAHSELDPEPSIFSSLQLAGAMLTIEQCYDLRLAGSELVVLNGCTTASGMESGGSLLAFQTAFLAAGAQRVMTSLWQLRDELAAAMMGTFYTQIATHASPTAALGAAQRQLLHHPELNHPATWAGYAMVRR